MTDPTPQTPTRDEAVQPSVQEQAEALRTHLTAIPMIEWVWDDAKMIFALLDRASAPAPASGGVDAVRQRVWSGVNPDGSALHPTVRQEMRDLLASLSPAATPVSEAGGASVEDARVAVHDIMMDELYIETPSSGPRISGDGICDATQRIIDEVIKPALAKPASSPAGGGVVREAFEACARIAGGRESDGTVSWPDGHEIAEAIREHADTWIKARLASQSISAGEFDGPQA